MKINQFTVITGETVTLVPYEHHHVEKYHEWMQSEELQILTASEPLSLSQEYEMQASWRNDEDKCTFIILDKAKLIETGDETKAMIGDVNIFLKENEDKKFGELEIMIAEVTARGKRKGKESVLLMLRYAIENLNLKSFEAIISNNNQISQKLFKKLGFEQIEESFVFKEVTLGIEISSDYFGWLKSETPYYSQAERK